MQVLSGEWLCTKSLFKITYNQIIIYKPIKIILLLIYLNRITGYKIIHANFANTDGQIIPRDNLSNINPKIMPKIIIRRREMTLLFIWKSKYIYI